MKEIHDSFEELVQIDECERDLQVIINILDRLRMVSEFRTEPYIHNADGEDIEILDKLNACVTATLDAKTKHGTGAKTHPYEACVQQKLAARNVNMTAVVIYPKCK